MLVNLCSPLNSAYAHYFRYSCIPAQHKLLTSESDYTADTSNDNIYIIKCNTKAKKSNLQKISPTSSLVFLWIISL